MFLYRLLVRCKLEQFPLINDFSITFSQITTSVPRAAHFYTHRDLRECFVNSGKLPFTFLLTFLHSSP